MKYKISQDIRIVCTLLDLTFSELAKEINVARSTITRVVKGETYPKEKDDYKIFKQVVLSIENAKKCLFNYQR